MAETLLEERPSVVFIDTKCLVTGLKISIPPDPVPIAIVVSLIEIMQLIKSLDIE